MEVGGVVFIVLIKEKIKSGISGLICGDWLMIGCIINYGTILLHFSSILN